MSKAQAQLQRFEALKTRHARMAQTRTRFQTILETEVANRQRDSDEAIAEFGTDNIDEIRRLCVDGDRANNEALDAAELSFDVFEAAMADVEAKYTAVTA